MNSGSPELKQWLVALGAILVGAVLFAFGRGSLPGPGTAASYQITVVPEDAHNLECASDVVLGNRRCGFDSASRPVPGERPLRPFVTVGRELLLLSGVFESTSVAAWVAESEKNHDDSRVTLECYARTLGVVPRVTVRWATGGQFQPETSVMSADVQDCVVKR